MILTTTETINGKEIETLGLVKGSTNDARALATKRMVGEAEAMGADAIVAVRYSSASVMQSAAEVMAYGTAVRFKN